MLSTIDDITSFNSPTNSNNNKSRKIESLKNLTSGLKMGGVGPHHVGSPSWQNKMDNYQKVKRVGHQYELLNKMLLRPKVVKENSRYNSPKAKEVDFARRKSIQN